MDDPDADREGGSSDLESRPPLDADLAGLCRELNRRGAKYVVVGGLAIIHAGFGRFTGDVDLLVATDPDNEARVFSALETLPDKAVRGLDPGDVARHTVVRIGDEILVDLMRSACGIEYAEAAQDVVIREVKGVPIPFASPRLLWRMKCRTHRAKDEADLVFLREWFRHHGQAPPE